MTWTVLCHPIIMHRCYLCLELDVFVVAQRGGRRPICDVVRFDWRISFGIWAKTLIDEPKSLSDCRGWQTSCTTIRRASGEDGTHRGRREWQEFVRRCTNPDIIKATTGANSIDARASQLYWWKSAYFVNFAVAHLSEIWNRLQNKGAGKTQRRRAGKCKWSKFRWKQFRWKQFNHTATSILPRIMLVNACTHVDTRRRPIRTSVSAKTSSLLIYWSWLLEPCWSVCVFTCGYE